MWVTIWRHGEAGAATIDRERQLTDRGRVDLQRGAECFLAHCSDSELPVPDTVYYSPWRRTMQTAGLLTRALGAGAQSPLPALQPGSIVAAADAALVDLFANTDHNGHLLLVSHQPLVSQLTDFYLGTRGQVPVLPPGGQVTLDVDYPAPGSALLKFWMFPPEYTPAS